MPIVSIEPTTPWSTMELHLEEFLLFSQLIGFSFHAFKQKCTCEEGRLGFLHTPSARSRSLCCGDSCSVTLYSIADKTCSLCPLLMLMMQTSCECTDLLASVANDFKLCPHGTRRLWGQAEYLSFKIGAERIGQCH